MGEKEKVYVPDEWDTVFEEYDKEEEKKEQEKSLREQEEEKERLARCGEILNRLEQILKAGPRYETAKEIRELLGKGPKGFSGGDPEIFQKKLSYIKEPGFLMAIKDYCRDYEIDKASYTQLLKGIPGDQSEVISNLRTYLYDKREEAPYRPLKKMNVPLAIFVILLVFGCQLGLGTDMIYAVFPALWVGVHWFLYRLFYYRFGGPGTHALISIVSLLALIYYVEQVIPAGVAADGLYSVISVYINIFFIAGCAWMPGAFRHSAWKKKRREGLIREDYSRNQITERLRKK